MRATPYCRSFYAADIAAGKNSETTSLNAFLCIGSACSMWLRRQDETPNQRLGCCAEAPTAEPWIDPAKETP